MSEKYIKCSDNVQTIDLTSTLDEGTTITTGAFSHLDNVVEIKLPQDCNIEEFAFIDCPNLKKVFIGSELYFEPNGFYNCPSLEQKAIENFSEIKIADLKQLCFFIPDYQRGYKWGESEITNLLNDLYARSKTSKPYALQPLVVKEMNAVDLAKIHFDFGYQPTSIASSNSNFIEVIDGQQRLTTLSLILSEIDSLLTGQRNSFFAIYYEAKRYSDEFFINDAIDNIIPSWFYSNGFTKRSGPIKSDHKKLLEEFKKYILDNVFFFYYKLSASSTESPYELFSTINKSIKLTNAELFKAFLLNTDSLSIKNQADIKRISYEWDQIERRMNEEEFWAFISCDDYDDKTHIDLLLDVFAEAIYDQKSTAAIESLKSGDKLFAYGVLRDFFSKQVNAIGENEDSLGEDKRIAIVKEIWESITEVFDFFMRIFNDYFLYHHIGFLRHSELYKNKLNLAELYKDYKKTNYIDFKKAVYEKVKNIFKDVDIGNVNFVRNKMELRDIFLYFNIWETMKNKRLLLRFPFYAHKNAFVRIDANTKKEVTWQIEHINPRSIDKVLQSHTDISKVSKAYLGADCQITNADDLKAKVEELKDQPEAHFNSIYNLCLLDSYTNVEYKDSAFDVKRSFIIRYDASSTYIPISTKQIFLKAIDEGKPLSDIISQPSLNPIEGNLWTIEEQETYVEQIKKCFAFSEAKYEEE